MRTLEYMRQVRNHGENLSEGGTCSVLSFVFIFIHLFIFLIFRITRGELGKFALMGELILEASVNPSSEQVLQNEGRCLAQILTLKPKPRCDNIGWGKLCVLDHKAGACGISALIARDEGNPLLLLLREVPVRW